MARNSGGSATISYYPSAVSPKRRIDECVWENDNTERPAEAAFVIAHDSFIHSGWYGEIGDAICNLPEVSIRVSCPDLTSHGLSDDEVPGGELRGYVRNFGARARGRWARQEGVRYG